MPPGKQQEVPLLTEGYLGCNTALQFSQLNRQQSPRMQNAWQPKIGAIGKRPGTVPVTTTALGNAITYLTKYKISPSVSAAEEIYAASNLVLYKYNGTTTLTALTMTNALASNVLNTTGFTNSLLVSVLVIGDGGILKQMAGGIVKDVVPAADLPGPAPANELIAVNAKGCKFVWEYKRQIFISPGTNEIFYSLPTEYDYIPETNYSLLTQDNDFVNGNGLAFDNVMLVPMRRSWNIWSGSDFNDFSSIEYLNTEYGVIAPKSITKLTYPDGSQTIAYMSDNEVHEIFTALNDGGGRQYATRSLMKDKIDFNALGLSEAEKAAMVGTFDARRSLYLLSFKKGAVNYTYAYDVRNREWYTDWLTFNAQDYVSLGSDTYYAGSTGHLHKFDDNLYSDWNQTTKTTGTPVYFKRYTPLLSLEFSGYSSYWDYYLIEARQFLVPSSLDITIVFSNSQATTSSDSPWVLNVAVYGTARYGQSRYANLSYTDIVNAPTRRVFKRKAKYIQVLWENPRDEPVEIYKDTWLGRTSGQ